MFNLEHKFFFTHTSHCIVDAMKRKMKATCCITTYHHRKYYRKLNEQLYNREIEGEKKTMGKMDFLDLSHVIIEYNT